MKEESTKGQRRCKKITDVKSHNDAMKEDFKETDQNTRHKYEAQSMKQTMHKQSMEQTKYKHGHETMHAAIKLARKTVLSMEDPAMKLMKKI